MTGTIVVGYDGRDVSRDALALALVVAKTIDAPVTIAGVFPHDARHMEGDAHRRALDEERERVLAPALEWLPGIRASAVALGDHSPARALHQLVEASDAEMIILGSSERGDLGRVLAGTTADRLLHGSPCPVGVAPAGYRQTEGGLRVLAVAFDGSPESRIALGLAARLASQATATIRVIGVLPGPAEVGPEGTRTRRAMRGRLRDEVHEVAAGLPDELRALPVVAEGGDAAAVLCEQAEKGVDLLVTGSRGYGPVRRVLLGSVSSMLMRSAGCPVLVAPRSDRPAGVPAGFV